MGTPALVPVGVDGAQHAPTGGGADLEVALDIDVGGSVAPGATVAVYFAPFTEQGWVDVITTAVHDIDNTPSVISISWGWAELEAFTDPAGNQLLAWSAAAMDVVDQTFQEAAWLGVSVLVASGDSGSDCQVGDGRAHVLYPASDPWVTSCGGTTIENVADFDFMEATWANAGGATGGGVSDHFAVPAWQAAVGIPPSVNPLREIVGGPGHKTEHFGRGIPDVAGNADPASGYMITVGGGPPQGPIGGTSAVAPLYAGLVALINERIPGTAGYLNPTLYDLHALDANEVFRDISDGATNAFNGAPGYACGPGWDGCTGLGSINGDALLAKLLQGPIQRPQHQPG